MKRRWWLPAGGLALYLMVAGQEATGEKPAVPLWLSSWDEGRRMARESGKPIFVVFRCEN